MQRAVGTMRIWLAVLSLLTVASCSKENNIDNSTESSVGIGLQCTAADDKGCGVGAVCALGLCRYGCTTDAECVKGALCIGDRPPFGCTLPAELACSSSQPCAAPLTCGIDGKCRNRCKVKSDCIRNEQSCIAGGCVSPSDPDTRWKLCVEGESACGSSPAKPVPGLTCSPTAPTGACDEVFVCHRTAIGWSSIGTCTADGSSHCGSANASSDTTGNRYATCSFPGPTATSPPSGCKDLVAIPRAGLPCTLGALGGPGVPNFCSAVYSVLINGTEVTDGFTHDCAMGTLQLSESLCSRLASGTPDVRVRACFP